MATALGMAMAVAMDLAVGMAIVTRRQRQEREILYLVNANFATASAMKPGRWKTQIRSIWLACSSS